MKLISVLLMIFTLAWNASKADEITDVEWLQGFLTVKYFHANATLASCTVFNSSNKPIGGGEMLVKGKVASLIISVPQKYRDSVDVYVTCEKVY